MQERPGGAGTPTKWQIAQETLAMLTTTFANRLQFGLNGIWTASTRRSTQTGSA
jgi:hypothetical protein